MSDSGHGCRGLRGGRGRVPAPADTARRDGGSRLKSVIGALFLTIRNLANSYDDQERGNDGRTLIVCHHRSRLGGLPPVADICHIFPRGLCVARSIVVGNARASNRGTSTGWVPTRFISITFQSSLLSSSGNQEASSLKSSPFYDAILNDATTIFPAADSFVCPCSPVNSALLPFPGSGPCLEQPEQGI